MKQIISLLVLIGALPVYAQEAPFVYDDHGKRDPFWALVNASGAIVNYDKDYSVSDLALEGIMVEPNGKNIAIINGKIVRSNEKIGVYLIKNIEPGVVTLQKGDEQFFLQLKKEE